MPDLRGVDQVKVKNDATLIFSHPAVPQGPLYIHSGANAIKWAYKLNTVSTPTIGGEVVQVLSALVGPMQIAGQTAGLKTNKSGQLGKNEVSGWKKFGGKDNYSPNDELREITGWFQAYMEVAGSTTRGNQRRDERAVHFVYPNRGWDFYIIPTSISGFRYDREVVSPEWAITAEIISDNALNFFSGITMSSFSDDILTNQSLIGQLGLSAFASSGTETNNPAFGQTGDAGSTDPFLNPAMSPSAAEMARKMGDNFQALVAAWSGGTFADFGFGALLDNRVLPKNVDQVYKDIFGSSFLSPTGAGGTQGTSGGSRGSTTYSGTGTQSNIAAQIANAFSDAGMPPDLGIATALLESSLDPNAANSSGHLGLFQNGISQGRATVPQAAITLFNNWNKQGSRLPGLSDAYPVSLQISQAAQWFKGYAPAGAGADTTDPATLQNWAIAAQGVTLQNNPLYGTFASTYLPQARNLLAQLNGSGSTTVSGSAKVARQFYKNPYRNVQGLTPFRIDQGVDYGGSGAVYALGKGQVTFVSTTSGWPGGGAVGYTLLDGPAAGKGVYLAENITPQVQVGDPVDSNTVIATMHNSYPYTESGWAQVGTDQPMSPLMADTGQSGAAKSFGVNFNQLLVALGNISGTPNGDPVDSPIPADWPRWT